MLRTKKIKEREAPNKTMPEPKSPKIAGKTKVAKQTTPTSEEISAIFMI
jgi:hypothetical protein